ncbi:MAG: hypothetical protein R2706_05395 [Acidimicrobiales bacterium]
MEDLHTLLDHEGDASGAAMAAAMVAMYLMMDTGLMAPVRGWIRRAERLLEGSDEAPAAAIIAVTKAYERFMCGDMMSAGQQAQLAIELGSRLDVAPAVIIGRVCTARVAILGGRVHEGLDLLDDIAIDLLSGAVDPLITGMMYCELICVAQSMALQDRANEWTEVMNQWRHGSAIGSVSGRCRVHRAELLRITGPCDEAEAEALAACDELRPWMRREFGWPLVELGNIRLRRGDLVGAEEAFLAAHERAWSPYPGLALLRLAQGDLVAASTLIANAIDHPLDIPSKERPPFGDLRRAPLFDAQAEIAAAAGENETVQLAARELEAIAAAYPSRSLAAGAALASARASLIEGDLEQAVRLSTAATVAWAGIGAPFEAAAARMVLGEACQRSGNTTAAQLEWEAARAAFIAFGADRWAARAAELLDDSPPDATPASTAGPAIGIFRCDDEMRTVSFGGRSTSVRDLVGFRYVERLLDDPGREFHVLDLVAVENGTLLTGRALTSDAAFASMGIGEGLPLLDDQARAAYRRRLADVDDDIEEATAMNDVGRVELARRDRDYLRRRARPGRGTWGPRAKERGRNRASSLERDQVGALRPEAFGRVSPSRCGPLGPMCAHRDLLRLHARVARADHLEPLGRQLVHACIATIMWSRDFSMGELGAEQDDFGIGRHLDTMASGPIEKVAAATVVGGSIAVVDDEVA